MHLYTSTCHTASRTMAPSGLFTFTYIWSVPQRHYYSRMYLPTQTRISSLRFEGKNYMDTRKSSSSDIFSFIVTLPRNNAYTDYTDLDSERRRDEKVREVGGRRASRHTPRQAAHKYFPLWFVTSDGKPSLAFISRPLTNTTSLCVLSRGKKKIGHPLRARWTAAPKHYYRPTPTIARPTSTHQI